MHSNRNNWLFTYGGVSNKIYRMFSALVVFLVLNSVTSSRTGIGDVVQEMFEDGLPKECLEVYRKLQPTAKVKMLDASSKLITSGILEGDFVDLGNFDECLDITDENIGVNGKYCMTTVDLKTFVSNFNPDKLNATSLLLNETQSKIKEFENAKVLGSQISSLLGLYTEFARFGICVPDKCKLDNLGLLKFEEDKCYTRFSNEDMDLFALSVLAFLYIFILVAVVSTFYDLITVKLEMKPKHDICVAFSLYTNGKKLLTTHSSLNQLSCLHGLKVFSMIWVVLGHSYLNMLSTSIDNIFYINEWIDNPVDMLILSATVSVDTFFTIGGLLTVYVFMNSSPKRMKESYKKIPLLYLHRYLRLTPAFAVMVLIYASGLVKYMGSGPTWYTLDSVVDNCRKNWWAALLYVQNYMDYSKMCVVQSWYLSADFQLFIITPFLLIPLRKYPKYVIPSLYAAAMVGMIIPFIIGYTNKWTGIGLGSTTRIFADDYYFVTHTRFAPYLIGMLAGYYVYKAKKSSKILELPMGYVLLLWLITFCGIFGCIFDGFKLVRNNSDAWVDGLYMGFNRSAWSLSISLLIFLCSTGHGGPVDKFLSLPMFQIVAKLTYVYVSLWELFFIMSCLGGWSLLTTLQKLSTTRIFADDYYFVTHARFAPYLIGMIAGYYVYKTKKNSKILELPMGYVLLLWLITFCGIFGCIFDGFKLVRNNSDAWVDGLYMGFNRSAWSLSISLLIFLCSTGHGGPVDKFLSLPMFQIVAKLTYAMYLVHYIVILCVNATWRTKIHFSNFSVLLYFFSYFSITLLLSVFFSLIFESPMITIERILFPKVRSKANKELPK